jgi:hypothetical protein
LHYFLQHFLFDPDPRKDEALLQPAPPVFPALLDLYLSGSLADVCLIAGDGEEEEEGRSSSNSPIRAHKAVLAASSGYFRALFAGAGASMMTTTTTATTTTTTTTTEEERGGGAPPLPTVRLPSLNRKQLEAVLEWIYSCGERVAFFKRGRARRQRRRGGTKGATAAAAAADRRRRNAGTMPSALEKTISPRTRERRLRSGPNSAKTRCRLARRTSGSSGRCGLSPVSNVPCRPRLLTSLVTLERIAVCRSGCGCEEEHMNPEDS